MKKTFICQTNIHHNNVRCDNTVENKPKIR